MKKRKSEPLVIFCNHFDPKPHMEKLAETMRKKGWDVKTGNIVGVPIIDDKTVEKELKKGETHNQVG